MTILLYEWGAVSTGCKIVNRAIGRVFFYCGFNDWLFLPQLFRDELGNPQLRGSQFFVQFASKLIAVPVTEQV